LTAISELLAEAQSHHHAGRLQDAQDLYAEIIEQDPTHGDALNLLGTVLAQSGQVEQAVAFLRRAVQAAPEVPNYACNLGVVLMDLGRYDQSKAAFEKAIKADRRFADAYYNLGKLYKQMELPGEAVLAFEQTLSLAPERFDALVNMGNMYFDQNRLAEAITCFKGATIDPEHDMAARAWINLGNTYRRMGDDISAIEAYGEVKGGAEYEPSRLDRENRIGLVRPRPIGEKVRDGRRLLMV